MKVVKILTEIDTFLTYVVYYFAKYFLPSAALDTLFSYSCKKRFKATQKFSIKDVSPEIKLRDIQCILNKNYIKLHCLFLKICAQFKNF